MPAPDLEPHCGSWVITDRWTGKAVFETFSRRTANAYSESPRAEVLTAAQYLGRLNARLRQTRPLIQEP
jgi:hypothetical protein